MITKEMESIIYGTLLGDAWLCPVYQETHNNRWQTAQKEGNKGYVEWLYNKLKPLMAREPYPRAVKSGFDDNDRTYNQYYLSSKCLSYFSHLRRIVFYKDGRKKVDQRILSKLTPIGLACWYMDDGCLVNNKDTRRIILNTQGYSLKENKIIIDYFKRKWDIEFKLWESRGKPILRANIEASLKLIEIVKPYVSEVDCMKYKLNFRYEMLNKSKYKAEYLRVFPEDKDIV